MQLITIMNICTVSVLLLSATKTNKMKTLEEVKEHFKNAKEVKCLSDGEIINIDRMNHSGIHKFSGSFWFDYEGEGHLESCLLYKNNNLAEIISYKDEYPKVMLVWGDDEYIPKKLVVFAEIQNKYIIARDTDFRFITKISNIKYVSSFQSYEHAKDLPTIKEVTLSEVAEKFNVSVENLRIKKKII